MKFSILLYISYYYCNYAIGDIKIPPTELSSTPPQPTTKFAEKSFWKTTKSVVNPQTETIKLLSFKTQNLIKEKNLINNTVSNNKLNRIISSSANEQVESIIFESTYKLYYFGIRGRAEAIRLLLHYAGVEFEDFYIPKNEWTLKYKKNTPYGHVPMLEERNSSNDIRILAESFAILRYLASRYNLATGIIAQNESVNNCLWAAAKVDELADFHKDVEQNFHSFFFPKIKTDFNTTAVRQLAKTYFGIYERQLKVNANTSGLLFSQLTWVDLLIADFFETIRYLYPTVFESYPAIVKFHGTIHNLPQLQKYLQKRSLSV